MTTVDNTATDLIALEKLILNYIAKIEKHQELLRNHKEMLESNLENDPVYQETAKLTKEASKKKQEEKARRGGLKMEYKNYRVTHPTEPGRWWVEGPIARQIVTAWEDDGGVWCESRPGCLYTGPIPETALEDAK